MNRNSRNVMLSIYSQSLFFYNLNQFSISDCNQMILSNLLRFALSFVLFFFIVERGGTAFKRVSRVVYLMWEDLHVSMCGLPGPLPSLARQPMKCSNPEEKSSTNSAGTSVGSLSASHITGRCSAFTLKWQIP